MARTYWVYIMASRRNGTLYTGVTSDIARRVMEHKNGATAGFTQRYCVTQLVHAEGFENVDEALAREKAVKKWRCAWKLELIEKENPGWRDLYDQVI
ncbi:GIY-YIG nuclease family protein [Allosphingosinicella indica]|uniref:Putative endonuclease n=1 Tax=Allosphingosinicella indica TaxID=941907 RepID=A0A1X7GKR7_9SPHN|nr:GIY-YIG nuclease family protein [Allosphingosinicella indica]SMF70792.1 putative endonuclease [Allosphingosinicella indica]